LLKKHLMKLSKI